MNKSRLSVAEAVGEDLVRLLTPYCARIEIAGSIRRQRPQVKDIELLCVSKVTSSPDMSGEVTTNHYALDLKLDELVADGSVLKKRPNKAGRYSYGKQNKLLVHVEMGISVDVFSTDAENWGMALLVRTGSRACWRAARSMGYRRAITYTLKSELGTSVKAAGWTEIGTAGGGTWNRKDRPRVDTHPLEQKTLWDRRV